MVAAAKIGKIGLPTPFFHRKFDPRWLFLVKVRATLNTIVTCPDIFQPVQIKNVRFRNRLIRLLSADEMPYYTAGVNDAWINF